MKEDLYKAQQLVIEFFNYNEYKNDLWWKLNNNMLGGISPNDMIDIGNEKKLIKMIFNQILEDMEE